MGILSDILEDNKERAGQFLSVMIPRRYRTEGAVARTLLQPCPLCASLYSTEEDLQSHILKAHARLQAYIKLNEQVIQDITYLEHSIEQLVLITLGDQDALVRLWLHEEFLREVNVSPGRPMELAPFIPKVSQGILKLEVRTGQTTKHYLIYNRTQPPISIEPLNDMVSMLQQPLLAGEEPNWSDFQANCLSKPSINFLEHRYLSGFYEYVLGSFLDSKQNRHAGEHFERCYGCLRPFATALAHTAKRLLGVKMNWFHLLDGCGPRSIFYHAKRFFTEPDSRRAESTTKGLSLRLDGPLGLYVDPFTETLMMAIECFYQRDYVQAQSLASQLESNPAALNRNNEDKLWLLKARIHLARGDHRQATGAYRHLEHHPLFGKEAARFV